MTKIKNFKVSLRPREMARWLKKERGLETTPELELSIEQMIKAAPRRLAPAAVYTTLTRQIAAKTTAIVFPENAIAASVIAVSIGSALEKERLSAPVDSVQESLTAVLKEEALAQALQFVVRLIQEQAKEEDCEMSVPVTAENAQIAVPLAALLGVQRIGIDLNGSKTEFPSYARVAWLFWTPVGKPAAKRTEKVAA